MSGDAHRVDLRYLRLGWDLCSQRIAKAPVRTSEKARVVLYTVIQKAIAEEFILITFADNDKSAFSGVGCDCSKPVVCPVFLDHIQCGLERIIDQTCGESRVLSIVQLDRPQALLSCKDLLFRRIECNTKKCAR